MSAMTRKVVHVSAAARRLAAEAIIARSPQAIWLETVKEKTTQITPCECREERMFMNTRASLLLKEKNCTVQMHFVVCLQALQ